MNEKLQTKIIIYEKRFEPDCRAIVAALPGWFGIPESNEMFIRNLAVMPSWIALSDNKTAGVITLERIYPTSFEAHFLAVHPEYHGNGIGRMLLERAEEEARKMGGRILFVKTLGPSHPDRNYAKTRAFYEAMGFTPLFETTAIWGERNPALVMVKSL